jgi:hypothetical protein
MFIALSKSGRSFSKHPDRLSTCPGSGNTPARSDAGHILARTGSALSSFLPFSPWQSQKGQEGKSSAPKAGVPKQASVSQGEAEATEEGQPQAQGNAHAARHTVR